MPTTYKSILLAQPADGAVVFIRRFTRDPPVLAAWDATAQQFTLTGGNTIAITGGTYAGTYFVTFTTNWNGSGFPAWFSFDGTIWQLLIELSPGSWTFHQTTGGVDEYEGLTTFATAPNRTETVFQTNGSPSWTGPTAMASNALDGLPLIIPASLVSAWRPQ